MAHEIENMFYVGQTPWHGLGVALNDPPSIEEGIRLAGLNWGVNVEPITLKDGRESTKARAIVRDTDRRELGVVGMDYEPLQNAEAFDWFQPFIDAKLATLHTAGSLRGGERVWVLAKLNSDNSVIVKGDEISKFLLLANGHDGKLACRCGFTGIRVVCANTMAAAIRSNASSLLRVRHTSGIKKTLDELREIMNTVNQQFEATAEQYRFLASKQVSEFDLRKYVKIVFSAPKKEGENGEDVNAKEGEMTRMLNQVVPLFEKGRGNDLPGVKGTWWAAYNAASEYLTWERGRTSDTRLNHLWFEGGARTNKVALETAMRLAA